MRHQFLVGYLLVTALTLWSLVAGNYEFLIYAAVTAILLGIIHVTDTQFHYAPLVLWGFDLWMLLHILGGLYRVGEGVLYSYVLIPLVGEPYSILKYDQLVHAYCYFIVALLMWRAVQTIAEKKANITTLTVIAVLAATGIGGLNEIVEFIATVVVPNTNVGGYENTAIDIVANFIGACIAVPFFGKRSDS